MKDATGSKRSRPNSDLEENDTKRSSDSNNKAEKQKRKKLRKRRSSSSPEEDIIDGFVIASYSSLRYLEVVPSNAPECLPPLNKDKNQESVEESNKIQEIDEELSRPLKESNKEGCDVKAGENNVATESRNGTVSCKESELSRQSPGQMTDDSSDSGNSGKGYICDGESEDEQVPKDKILKSTVASEVKKDVAPIKVDLSKDDDEPEQKNEKSFQIGLDTQKSVSSPKSSSFHPPSLSFSSSSSHSISQSSRSAMPQSSWPPRLSSSSFKKPLSVVEPCCGSAYSGADALHQELNNRFLQSHSEMERNSQHSKSAGHEMHQHSHLHHHQHQHQHTHYYPSPLLAPSYFPTPAPVPGMLSPFSTPVPTYGSHVISPYNKKTGKWCAAHVQIAWKIYCHQRVQTEMSKDPHAKPEQLPMTKSSSTIFPPFSSRRMSPSDLDFHSSHLHSSRFSASPFGKPPVLIARSNNTSTAVTSSISAFSSVSSAPPASRRPGSPVIITPSRTSSTSEIFGRRSPSSGPSTLYPWLKSEPKTPEIDPEKSSILNKREFQTKSPARPSNSFSIQALAGERSETIKPSPPSALDTTRFHSSREHRPCETRSIFDNPLVPGLISLEKRPIDYRPSAGSIDLNRNSLYPRFDPMHALYSHHVTPLTSHIAGYHYPGSSFVADYHSGIGAPGHGMVLGARDPLSSLVRTADAPLYIRQDLDDRLGGRH